SGDAALVRDRAHRLIPHLVERNRWEHNMDCVGCARSELALFLGEVGDGEGVEAVLQPMLRPFRGNACYGGIAKSLAAYTALLLRRGQIEDAARYAEKALAAQKRQDERPRVIEPILVGLEVALAAGQEASIRTWLRRLKAHVPEISDDPYFRHAALL